MRGLRWVPGVAAAVVLAVIVLEFAALPLASRSALTIATGCSQVDDLEVTSLRRPAVAGMLRGELRDVRIDAAGVRIGPLVIETLRVELPVVPLVGRRDDPTSPTTALAAATVTEESLTDYLEAVAPESASPIVTVAPDRLRIGDRRVPFTLDLRARVVDGDVRLVPVAGDERLWQSLGLSLHVRVPAGIELQSLQPADGEIRLRARVELPSGSGDGVDCREGDAG